nr:ABC transporter A family member 9-like [Tanacetum cinerariifolium]GFA25057.1 ABC transporter A family member 9-like [Tanacetum cinerariifolium]
SVSKPCSACSRVFVGDIYGDHVILCAWIIGIKHRHNVVRDTLVDICYRSRISAGKKVDIGLDGGRDKPLRPTDMLLYSWDEGLDVCVDLTGSSPLTQTGMVDFTKLLRHTSVVSPGPIFDDALSVFNTSMETDLLSNPKSTFSLSPRQMALWNSQREDHTSDWLRTVPISGLRQTMNWELEADAVTLLKRIWKFSMTQDIGAPCSKVFGEDIYGDHDVLCAGSIGIKHRHNVMYDTFVDICYCSRISAGKEVDIGLDGGVTIEY